MRAFMYTCILYMHIISHNGYGQQTLNYVPSRKGKPHVITAKENLEYQPHCTALHYSITLHTASAHADQGHAE